MVPRIFDWVVHNASPINVFYIHAPAPPPLVLLTLPAGVEIMPLRIAINSLFTMSHLLVVESILLISTFLTEISSNLLRSLPQRYRAPANDGSLKIVCDFFREDRSDPIRRISGTLLTQTDLHADKSQGW